jgi:signal transduction histidine kinase
VLVLLGGMLFGRRGAWSVAAGVLVTYGLLGLAFDLGALHTTSSILDPSQGLNWLRVGLVQAALGLVIALASAAALKSLEESFAARLRAQAAQRKAERALAESQKLEAVGRLAAGVAHDFNNLLTIVSGWTTLIERGGVTEQQEGVVAIKAAAEQAAQLTKQLLTFARRGERENAATDACDRVRNTAATLARIFPDSVKVRVEADEALPPVGISDGLLDQVLLNLSINARDAMPDGGTLTLQVTRAAPGEANGLEGDLVVVRAIDTGTGMSDEVRARIFEPFFTTKAPGKGTGFGLATVFGIVQAQGGAIDVESIEGKGSTFSVFLPARPRL